MIAAIDVNAGSVLSLLATLAAVVVFSLMLSETISLARGRDPFTNRVRSGVRRFPRFTYMVAVVIGLVLGHFFWT